MKRSRLTEEQIIAEPRQTDKMYTGQQRETADGIYYYGARFYNADIGRFLQADSIVPEPGNPQALNRYSYVLNNPIRYSDPTGHKWMDDNPATGGSCTPVTCDDDLGWDVGSGGSGGPAGGGNVPVKNSVDVVEKLYVSAEPPTGEETSVAASPCFGNGQGAADEMFQGGGDCGPTGFGGGGWGRPPGGSGGGIRVRILTTVTTKDGLNTRININSLRDAAREPYGIGRLTVSGRGLQKAVDKPNTAFQKPTDRPLSHGVWNESARRTVDEILNNPNTTYRIRETGGYGDVVDVKGPDGRGIFFSWPSREFIGFRQP